MRLIKKISTGLLAGLLTTTISPKAEAGIRIGAGGAFPFGININAGYRFSESDNMLLKRIGIRGDYNFLDIDMDFDIDGEEYETNFDNEALGLLIDFHPFANTLVIGGFRITGGYYFNSKIKASGTINGIEASQEVEVGGQTVTIDASDEWIKTTFDWDLSGAYLGLGWDLGLFAGLQLNFDLGAIFGGDEITADVTASPNLSILTDNLEEEEKNVTSDIEVDYIPMVKFAIGYQF